MANVIFVAAVFVLAVLAYLRPGFACGYVLASYALEQCAQAFIPLAGQNNALCNYLIAGTVLVGIGGQLIRTGFGVIRIRAPSMMVMLLIGYCYLTVLWSIFPSTTSQVLATALPYLVVFAGLTPFLVVSGKDLSDALLSLLWCATGSLVLLLLFAEWGSRGIILPYQRAEANPLVVSEIAGALLVTVAVAPQVKELRHSLRWPVIVGCVGVVLVVFLRSGSRGQVIAALVTTLLFSNLRKDMRWVAFLVIAVGALMFTSFLGDEVDRHASRWDTEKMQDAVFDGRVGKAEALLDFWSRSSLPRLFFGLGNATAQDPRLLGSYPHVVPAEVLAEEGLVGFAIYILAILVAVQYLARGYRAASEKGRSSVLAIAALLTFQFLVTLKQGTLFGGVAFLLLLVLPGSVAEDTVNKNL